MSKVATSTDQTKWIFGNYKPVWMFWHPGSGFYGGLIFGSLIAVGLHLFGVF
jgi:hypothetical protein